MNSKAYDEDFPSEIPDRPIMAYVPPPTSLSYSPPPSKSIRTRFRMRPTCYIFGDAIRCGCSVFFKFVIMMEKELSKLFETVKKAADAAAAAAAGGANTSPEEDRCLDALKRLKNLPVNYQVLVSTQVGKRLRQLTKHPRKRIQSLASYVVETWTGIIVKEIAKNRKSRNIEHEGSIKAETGGADSEEQKKVGRVNTIRVGDSVKAGPTGADSGNGRKFQRVSKVKKVSIAGVVKADRVGCTKVEKMMKEENSISDLRKRAPPPDTPKLTSILCTKPKDQIRDKVRELIAEALCKVITEVGEEIREEVEAHDPYRIATMVEVAMFQKWGRSNGPQKFKYRSILFNIKDQKNPDFRRKVLLGQFPPHSLVDLSPEDMASDARQEQNEEIKKKALLECERRGPPEATTDAFKCYRCGKNETTYYQMQTRSADEPMTTFITCVKCNNRWKV